MEHAQKADPRLYNLMKAFQIAAEESGSLVFTYDTRTQTIFVDERTARAFGVAVEQPGVPYDMVKRGVVSRDTQAEYLRIHEAILNGAREAGGVVKLIRADGTESVQDLKFRAILDQQGNPTGTAVGVYRDITDRYIKDLEQERYRQAVYASERFTFRYEAARDALTIYSPPETGNGTEEICCYYESFLEQMESGAFCPVGDIPILRGLLQEGARRSVQVQLYSPSTGEKRWYAITAKVSGTDGLPKNVYGLIWDITDVVARETALRKLEMVLQGMRDEYIGIFEIDLEQDAYTVLTFDRGRLCPMSAQGSYTGDLLNSLKTLVIPESWDEVFQFADLAHLKSALAAEKRIEMEYMTTLKDRAWRRTAFQVIERKNGAAVKAAMYQMDIDSQKMERLRQQQAIQDAYQYAEAASSAKTEFLSRMSHDIRTPMNAIIGMTAIAGTNLRNPRRVEDCLNKITAASKHLLSLINEVLDMSKIESGSVELQEEEFSLAELIDGMLALAMPQIKQHGHDLRVTVEHMRHERVIGDGLRIQQAFVNLLSNAVKYTPDGGTIRVSVREKPSRSRNYGEYEFCFEDNGIGMSEEFQKVLFEPFTRAEDGRLNRITGTGLGMTITRNLIRMMDGDIRVESKLNQGTRFTVTVHLKIQEDERERPEELRDLPVLVADDDPGVCESAGIILNEIGMKGEWCLSGYEAVQKARERHLAREDYFAIILDWKMPGMDGVETARRIRAEVGDEIPIIFLTAYDWSEIEGEARAAGVTHFMAKPLFKSRLLNSFKSLIGSGRGGPETMQVFSEKASFEGRRILLVEDNELNAEIAQELLRMTGVQVDWARNGQEALAMAERSEQGFYDLALMDIQMPVMDGYKTTEALRGLPREDLRNLPIVAMTANAFAEDVNRSVSAGMSGHISKPVDIQQLERVLLKYLG